MVLKDLTIVLFQVSDHSGAGNIQIEPFEKGSKSITLLNKGDAEVNIGGWTLTNTSGDDESSYKFHRAIAIPAGGSCTVHSADSTEVVMRITSRPFMSVSDYREYCKMLRIFLWTTFRQFHLVTCQESEANENLG